MAVSKIMIHGIADNFTLARRGPSWNYKRIIYFLDFMNENTPANHSQILNKAQRALFRICE